MDSTERVSSDLTWTDTSHVMQEDHFPGCQSEFVPVVLPGAPNLRAVPGTNVYGVALPTLDGIRGTLRHVGAAPGSRDAHGREVGVMLSVKASSAAES